MWDKEFDLFYPLFSKHVCFMTASSTGGQGTPFGSTGGLSFPYVPTTITPPVTTIVVPPPSPPGRSDPTFGRLPEARISIDPTFAGINRPISGRDGSTISQFSQMAQGIGDTPSLSTGMTDEDMARYKRVVEETIQELKANRGFGALSEEDYKAMTDADWENLAVNALLTTGMSFRNVPERLAKDPVILKIKELNRVAKEENVRVLLEKYPGAWEVDPQNGQRAWFLPEGDYEAEVFEGGSNKAVKKLVHMRGAQLTEDGKISGVDPGGHSASQTDANPFIWEFANLQNMKSTGRFNPKTFDQLPADIQAKIRQWEKDNPPLPSIKLDIPGAMGGMYIFPEELKFDNMFGFDPRAIFLIPDGDVKDSILAKHKTAVAEYVLTQPGQRGGGGGGGGGGSAGIPGVSPGTWSAAVASAGGAAAQSAAASAMGISLSQQYLATHQGALDAAVASGQMSKADAKSLAKGWEAAKGIASGAISPTSKVLGFDKTDPKFSVPLSPELMAEGLNLAAIENAKLKADNKPQTADAASELAKAGYTKAVSQMPGAVNDNGQWRMKNIADATAMMKMLADGAQQETIDINGTKVPLVEKYMEVDGKWQWVANWTKDADGNWKENTYITASGVPKAGIWFNPITTLNNRNILIHDPKYVAEPLVMNEKGEMVPNPLLSNWITPQEFSDAVSQGRVGLPAVIEANRIQDRKSIYENPLYTTLTDNELNAFFKLNKVDDRKAYLEGVYKNKGDKNPLVLIGGTVDNAVALVNEANNIGIFAQFYPDGKGGYQWDKVIGAMLKYEETGDESQAFADSPLYQEQQAERLAKSIELNKPMSGLPISEEQPFTQSGANTTLDEYRMDLTGVVSTRYTVGVKKSDKGEEQYRQVTIEYLDQNGKVIDGSSRSYLQGTDVWNRVAAYVNDNVASGRVVAGELKPVVSPTPASVATPPVQPPVTPPVAGASVSTDNVTTQEGEGWNGVVYRGDTLKPYSGKGLKVFGIDLVSGEPIPDLSELGVTVSPFIPSEYDGKVIKGLTNSGMPVTPEMRALNVPYYIGKDSKWYSWTNKDNGNTYSILYDRDANTVWNWRVNNGEWMEGFRGASSRDRFSNPDKVGFNNEIDVIRQYANGNFTPYIINKPSDYTGSVDNPQEFYVSFKPVLPSKPLTPTQQVLYPQGDSGWVFSVYNTLDGNKPKYEWAVPTTANALLKNIPNNKGITVLQFGYDGCPGCGDQLTAINMALRDKYGFNNPNLNYYYVNVYSDDGSKLIQSKDFYSKNVPYTVIYKDNVEIGRYTTPIDSVAKFERILQDAGGVEPYDGEGSKGERFTTAIAQVTTEPPSTDNQTLPVGLERPPKPSDMAPRIQKSDIEKWFDTFVGLFNQGIKDVTTPAVMKVDMTSKTGLYPSVAPKGSTNVMVNANGTELGFVYNNQQYVITAAGARGYQICNGDGCGSIALRTADDAIKSIESGDWVAKGSLKPLEDASRGLMPVEDANRVRQSWVTTPTENITQAKTPPVSLTDNVTVAQPVVVPIPLTARPSGIQFTMVGDNLEYTLGDNQYRLQKPYGDGLKPLSIWKKEPGGVWISENLKQVEACSADTCGVAEAGFKVGLAYVEKNGWKSVDTLPTPPADVPTVAPPLPTPPVIAASETTSVMFTPLSPATNQQLYVDSMIAKAQFIKFFGGNKDWQSSVDTSIVMKEGKVDYPASYSKLIEQKISFKPPVLQPVVTTDAQEQFMPKKIWTDRNEAEMWMRQLMTDVANRENAGKLTEQDKAFKRIIMERPMTTGQVVLNPTVIMSEVSRKLGDDYALGREAKPLSLPTIDKFFGTFNWNVSARPRVSQPDIFTAAKLEMTADYQLAKQRENFDKAMWNSLTPEDRATRKPEITTTEYDRKIIANWEDPKKFISSTKQPGVDPRNYYGLAIEMGKEQVVIDKAQAGAIRSVQYAKEEGTPIPRITYPTVTERITQRSVFIQPAVVAYDKVEANPKDPTITQQDLVYHGIIKTAKTNTLRQLNVNQAYELIMSSPYPIVSQLQGEEGGVAMATTDDTSGYPRLATPIQTITTPSIPTATQLLTGSYPGMDRFIGNIRGWDELQRSPLDVLSRVKLPTIKVEDIEKFVPLDVKEWWTTDIDEKMGNILLSRLQEKAASSTNPTNNVLKLPNYAYNLLSQEEIDNIKADNKKGYSSIFYDSEKGLQGLVKLGDGNYIPKSTFDSQPIEYQILLKKVGIDSAVEQSGKDYNAFVSTHVALPSGEWIRKSDYDRLTPVIKEQVRTVGLKALDTTNMTDKQKQQLYQSWGLDKAQGDKNLEQILNLNRGLNPARSPEVAAGIAVGMIPVAGTLWHWTKMEPWERGLSVGADLISIIAGIGFLSSIARATRGAAIPFKTKAFASGLKELAIQEVIAPITLIKQPEKVIGVAVRTVESGVSPKYVPLAALEIRQNLVKIPVRRIGSEKEAVSVRDALTNMAVAGDQAEIVTNGKGIKLAQTALQQKITPAIIHATPDIRPYLKGVVVKEGREGGLFLAPTLSSRFTNASAFGDIAADGIPGAIIITDKNILNKLATSGKIYKGTVEVEAILKTGIELPVPSQLLYTRDAAGKKIVLAIIGKPLSFKDISKLKFFGAVDAVKDIFRPAYQVKGLEDYVDELSDIGRERIKLESELESVKKTKNIDKVNDLEKKIDRLDIDARRLSSKVDNIYRIPMNPSRNLVGISDGDFIDRETYREYAKNNPVYLNAYLQQFGERERNIILNDRMDDYTRDDWQSRYYVPRSIILERGEDTSRPIIRTREDYTRDGIPIESRRISVDRLTTGNQPVPVGVPYRVPPYASSHPPVKPTPIPSLKKVQDLVKKGDTQGLIAWKQGFIYKVLFAPYGQTDILNSRKPVEGIEYHEGIRSAYNSIVRRGGYIPPIIRRDMGIYKVEISTLKDQRKPELRFTRDVKDVYKGKKRIAKSPSTRIVKF